MGLVAGLFGVLPNRVSTKTPAGFSHYFQPIPVQANDTEQPVASAGAAPVLTAWPDLVADQPAKPASGRSLPLKRAAASKQAATLVTTAVEAPPAPSDPIQIAAAGPPPPSSELAPSMDEPQNEEEVLASVAEEGVILEDECESAEGAENVTEDVAGVSPVAEGPAPVALEAPSPVLPTLNKKKGYIIKPEGADLVVYDASGKELFRKTRNGHAKTPILAEKPQAIAEPQLDLTPKNPAPPKAESVIPRNADGTLVFYEVKKGDNPSIIAKKFPGVTAEKIMKANGIRNPSSIQIGTHLWIPGTADTSSICHVVEEGETLSELLEHYEINNLFEVCDINGLSRTTNELIPGTKLVLPGAKAKLRVDEKPRVRALTVDVAKFTGRGDWAWPLEGEKKVSSGYGLRIDPFTALKRDAGGGDDAKRSFHHGIDISVPVGTPVVAARDGEVVKVSSSRWGHGKMIQLQHEDGWFTVYSHNSRILKKTGDKVKQGEVIAQSGNTGRSTGPHVHFEIRRPDQKSVNPKTILQAIR